jgi:hypothetical protein
MVFKNPVSLRKMILYKNKSDPAHCPARVWCCTNQEWVGASSFDTELTGENLTETVTFPTGGDALYENVTNFSIRFEETVGTDVEKPIHLGRLEILN